MYSVVRSEVVLAVLPVSVLCVCFGVCLLRPPRVLKRLQSACAAVVMCGHCIARCLSHLHARSKAALRVLRCICTGAVDEGRWPLSVTGLSVRLGQRVSQHSTAQSATVARSGRVRE